VITDRRKAYIYTSIVVFLWSTVATAFKIGLRYMSPPVLLFFSALFASMALGLILCLRKEPLRNIRQALPPGAALGVINPFLYYLVLFKAYSLLPAQEAQPLNFTWPVVLVLLSALFLSERLEVRDIISMAVCFSGVWVVSSHGKISGIHFNSIPGTLLALGSSLFWSTYWILNRNYRGDKTSLLFFSLLSGTLYTGLFLFVTGGIALPDPKGLAACLYTGLFEMGITFLIWAKALEYTESAALISNFLFLSPFISLIFIHLVLGEDIVPSTIIGLILIITGILIQKLHRRQL